MGVAAVVHLKVFPAKPYRRGERCVRNVAVMSDYASLGTPPDPEEVRDSGRLTRVHVVQPEDTERRLSFPQSVRDVVLGSSEIVRSWTSSFYPSLFFCHFVKFQDLLNLGKTGIFSSVRPLRSMTIYFFLLICSWDWL